MPKARHPSGRGRKSVGLYVLLVLLPLLVVLPLLGYSAALLYLMAGQATTSTERELEAANGALVSAIQREIDQAQEIVNLAASSPSVGESAIDAPQMISTLERIAQSDFGLRGFTFLDPQGRVVLQYPRALPQVNQISLGPHQYAAFATGKTIISDLHETRFDDRLWLSINQPIRRGGQVRWVLSARFDPQHLARVAASQVGARDAVATVLDTQGRIVARTREMERFFGQRPSEEMVDTLAERARGTQRIATLDGNDFLWSWSPTPISWTVLLGIPARRIDQTLQESMLRLGLAGLAVLLATAMGTMMLARRIARSVDRMAANAPLLAAGAAQPYRPSGIRQLDDLYMQLELASSEVARALNERAQALEAERAARAVADAHNKAKDVFIATLSHELRNPLAPVRAAVTILKSPRADGAARGRATDVIDRQVTAMARLLDDLLDMARVSSGRIVLEREWVSLRDVIDSAVELARPLIESREHRFNVELPAQNVQLYADPLRLAQVFGNLLTNAAKYTDPHGRISVTAQLMPNEVVVSVQDNGIGLPAEAVDQVFQMFAQVRGVLDRSQGGLGIGLALVRGLVDLHGGWVRAESDGPGLGSVFSVGLPLVERPPAPTHEPEPT